VQSIGMFSKAVSQSYNVSAYDVR